ncbi:O-methyltransferase [Chryseobacterium sp.]|uniref:O-methyltransferase n=1 Tax=Chryseobacterium sp. TaxID=1871047 RepID=UPI0025BDC21D|nr:O-methyltransferase [Chryseobacterium sp.]
MNTELKNKILKLYEGFKEEDNIKENRLDRWRNLEPESAEFISILIRSQQSKNVLEIGTSNGFSTLWLSDAVKSTGGKLISVEIEESRTLLAKNNLTEFGLMNNVELITADAKDYLAKTAPVFDTIFLDAERKYYTEYWPELKRLLSKDGALLIVDNVISHQHQVEDFQNLIIEDTGFTSTVVNVGKGILLVTKN